MRRRSERSWLALGSTHEAFGYRQTVFTREMWDRWLERLNRDEPNPDLAKGIKEMRRLLQTRCIGAMHEKIESTATYRTFVEKQFGSIE